MKIRELERILYVELSTDEYGPIFHNWQDFKGVIEKIPGVKKCCLEVIGLGFRVTISPVEGTSYEQIIVLIAQITHLYVPYASQNC
jgi:hypothetical protein